MMSANLCRRVDDCRRPAARVLFVGLAVLVIAGCGKGFSTVSGTVTLDGQPLVCDKDVHGTIQFYPEGGAGAPAVGQIDGQGQYTLSTGSSRGVQPGRYVVTIAATRIIPPASPGEAPGGQAVTPAKYASPKKSEWHVEVKPGSNSFSFNMESHP